MLILHGICCCASAQVARMTRCVALDYHGLDNLESHLYGLVDLFTKEDEFPMMRIVCIDCVYLSPSSQTSGTGFALDDP